MAEGTTDVAALLPTFGRFRHSNSPKGVTAALQRLTRSLRKHGGVYLGANNATEDMYDVLFSYYDNGDILLINPSGGYVPSWIDDYNRTAHNKNRNKLIHIVTPSSLRNTNSFVIFEPGQIVPELIDFRHGYLKKAVPVVYAHHSLSYRIQLKTTFMPLIMSPTIEGDTIVCSSSSARTAINKLLDHVCETTQISRDRFKGRLDVIPYGIDTDKFKPTSKLYPRKMFGIPADGFVILCFGRTSPADKADLLPLLYAFRELRRTVHKAYLIIAGNSREKKKDFLFNEIRSRGLADGVITLKLISDDDRVYLYNAADIFVSLSDSVQECFGLTVVEAMACGIPQIVSDWNGYRDLVDHGKTGFRAQTMWSQCDDNIAIDGILFQNDFLFDHFKLGQSVAVDIRNTIDWISLLAANSELRESMSQESRRRAVSQYSQPVMAGRYASLFKEVSEQAKTQQNRIDKSFLYRVPNYYKCFAGHASVELAASSVLKADRARADIVLRDVMPYAGLFTINPYDGWSLSSVIEILAQSQDGMSLSDLIKTISLDTDKEMAMRQILWLIKYGCIICNSGGEDFLVTL
jgi:D-inositol-3-phosphate glycosyltransferase